MLSHFSHVRLFATLWTVARQAPLTMGFCRQEYWSGLPCPPPGDLSNPGIKPMFLKSPILAGGFFTSSTSWEALSLSNHCYDTLEESVFHHTVDCFKMLVCMVTCKKYAVLNWSYTSAVLNRSVMSNSL